MRSRARKLHSDLVDIYGGLVKEIDERIQADGEVRDCLVKTVLLVKECLDEPDITILASAIMIGEIETVPSPPLLARMPPSLRRTRLPSSARPKYSLKKNGAAEVARIIPEMERLLDFALYWSARTGVWPRWLCERRGYGL
jgi:hypothetical protein